MSVMIQLRNVPEDLHRKLKSRAAEAGVSMSEYILRDIRKKVEQPSSDEVRRMLAKLRPLKLTESPEQTIRAMRDGR